MKNLKEELEKIMCELAGASSLCWNERPIGIFDSTQALKFVEEAMPKILSLIESDRKELVECLEFVKEYFTKGDDKNYVYEIVCTVLAIEKERKG